MSKEKEEKKYSTKSIINAILPWGIIYTMLIGGAGLLIGWTERSEHEGRINALTLQNATQIVDERIAELKVKQ